MEAGSLPPLPPVIDHLNAVSRYRPRRIINLDEMPIEFPMMSHPGLLADTEQMKDEIQRQVGTDQWWKHADEEFAARKNYAEWPNSTKGREAYEKYQIILEESEELWRYGEDKIEKLQRDVEENIIMPVEEKRKYLDNMGLHLNA